MSVYLDNATSAFVNAEAYNLTLRVSVLEAEMANTYQKGTFIPAGDIADQTVHGITISDSEYQCLSGVSSNIQGQINTITSTLIAVPGAADSDVSLTEYNTLNGITTTITNSQNVTTNLSIQNQFDTINQTLGSLSLTLGSGSISQAEFLTLNGITTSPSTLTIQGQLNALSNRILNTENMNASSNYIPTGTIFIYAKPSPPPTGFLMCQGQKLLKSDYPDLYSVIGDIYSYNRTSTNSFWLPDLRQCYVKGSGTNTTYPITSATSSTGQFQLMSVQQHRHQLIDHGAGTKTVTASGLSETTVVADDTTSITRTLYDIFYPTTDTIFENETRGNCISMNYMIKL